MIFNHQENSRL